MLALAGIVAGWGTNGRGTGVMARKKLPESYYDVLQARFAGKKLAEGKARTAPGAAAFTMPEDPADRFFGARAFEETPDPLASFDPAGARGEARALGARIDAFSAAERSYLAQAIRLAVGVIWLALAGWLFLGAGGAGAISVGDAGSLTQLFAILGAVGVAGAILAAMVTTATGKASDTILRAESTALGTRLAADMRALETLSDPQSLSLEARHYLSSAAFAGNRDGDREETSRGFDAFVSRGEAKSGRAAPGLALLIVLAVAALAGFLFLAGRDASLPGLAAYPALFSAVLIGAGLYAFAGLIVAFAGRSVSVRAGRDARIRAYESFSAAFESADAPAPLSLARRFEGRGALNENPTENSTGTNHWPGARADGPAFDGPTPTRGRDSGPEFVETGFLATPRTFRTDAFSKKMNCRRD